jgi:tetratricopeptide (TPR) repeat protein
VEQELPIEPPSPAPARDPKQIRLTPPPRIDPIRPPEQTAANTPASARFLQLRRWLSTAVALALGGALIFVLVILPRWVEKRDQSELSRQARHDSPTTSLPRQVDTDPDLERAQRALDAASQLQLSLKNHGAADWAPDRYSSVLEAMAAGRDRLASDEPVAAAEILDQTIEELQTLERDRPQALKTALAAGSFELARGDSSAAIAAFRLAGTIEPGNRDAAAGLARAEVLDQVLELLDEAGTAEERGDLPRAVELYRAAAALDPQSAEARDGVQRSSAGIDDLSFSYAMSVGLGALENGDYVAAEEAFRRAAELRPGSPETTDGLTRVEAGIRLHTIAQGRRRAESYEDSERWQAAVTEYEAALSIDPALAFAQAGRDRAAVRARLADRIDFHISHPERLASAEVVEEASELLEEAQHANPRGPVLSEQIDQLQRTIRIASTPVRVELVSDNLTDIVVHHVGHLGVFFSRSLELRPGTYTVVGTRRGYRDVRVLLRVKPEVPAEPLVVRCEEEI